MDKIIQQFQLSKIPQDDIKLIDIDNDCKLKELTEKTKSTSDVKIGCSFCEFKGELESIPEPRKIIFMDEVITVTNVHIMED